MGFQLSTFCFEILRRVALWRAHLIYDFTFMDVDKIFPFSSTIGWHSLNVNGKVQKRKGLRWIPRHPETRKGIARDEMLQGVESKHRSGDSQIGHPFKLSTESMSRQETTWRTK
ncbi:unnamed protein product [Triticum turgidum subsp. durum]|uniref:Uncharacterized protein n=1 Tax=Triticum turgidum subsp. durum TaxID=4567 RepID=A0A9R0ZCG1_TRITD|nr:unnamed protein product [Triticum turgidum subsp. durum]